ncbi:MAG: ORC1-type DNA replication protein 2 [Candidatus Heimdallarchaeota archaeon LC_3]|nr:MAG: ORC1-type DNA replication protein 2 [Candidatus Heimdallarchaeota archaeon LC_3]
MSKNIHTLIKDELGKDSLNSSLIYDDLVFSPDYLPYELPHRQEQILELTKFFSSIFTHANTNSLFRQSVILVGPHGSGKTATSKRFGFDIEEISKKKITNFNLIYRHLNCRQSRTVYLLLVDLLRSLIPNFPQRGLSVSELIRELLETLEKNNLYLILALDEVEFLIRDTEINNLLYTFTRINDESNILDKQRISVIVITENNDFLYSLDSSTKSSLAKNIIVFNSYSSEELKNIVKLRLKLAITYDILDDHLIEIIVKFSTKINGNLRVILEILHNTFKIADQSNKLFVSRNMVELAKNNFYPINREILRDLPMTQKITLLSVGKVFKNKIESQKVTLIMVKRQYHIECNKYNLSIGQGHTSFWSYIQKLDELSLIQSKVVNYGTKGRSTEIFLEIPPYKIIREIEHLIKRDLQKKVKF